MKPINQTPAKALLFTLAVIASLGVAAASGDTEIRTFHSQPCIGLATKEVEIAVTRLGAHMPPVTFFRDSGKPLQPNVKTLEFAPDEVTFISTTGERVTAPVGHEFLKTGKL